MKAKAKGRGRGGSAGVTLVESLVGIMIFSGFIGGACRLMVTAYQLTDRATVHYAAVNMAKTRLERVKTFSYDQVELCQEAGVVLDREGRPSNSGVFRLATTVQPRGNVKDITVRVDIRNARTLRFDGENEQVISSVANLREAPRN